MQKTPKEFLEDYRKDQVVTAALEIIDERGFEQVTVDEIARRAGVSRSTVYLYFANKQEILTACLSWGRELLFEQLERQVGAAQGLRGQLEAFVEVILERVDAGRNVYRAVTNLASLANAADGPGGTEVAGLIKDFNGRLGAILSDAAERGELRPELAATAHDSLATLVFGALTARTLSPAPPPAAEAAEQLVNFALLGIATPETSSSTKAIE